VLSVALLFFPALSPAFFVLYVAGGLSDMIDGAVARKTGTVSGFGSRLDTFADIVFAAVCLIKLLPALDAPVWLYVWVAVIAFIKFSSIIAGFIRQKQLGTGGTVPFVPFLPPSPLSQSLFFKPWDTRDTP
jgi:CDP-diacylglycerol--glycerol-3-phosphate 3-phosphatidyltransferase